MAQSVMRQVGEALSYLYQNNVIHRDLKLQNILLSEKNDDKAIIKIADFGLAKQYEGSENLFDTIAGTPIYMAPEIQKGEAYSDKSDLWSVGVILFELVCGFPPFGGRNKTELRMNIDRGTYKFPPEVKVSRMCKHLIASLL